MCVVHCVQTRTLGVTVLVRCFVCNCIATLQVAIFHLQVWFMPGVSRLLFLLLLHSPVISLGFTILGKIFTYVTVYKSNHRGGVFLSLAFIHLGQRHQDLKSPCNGRHTKTGSWSILCRDRGGGWLSLQLCRYHVTDMPARLAGHPPHWQRRTLLLNTGKYSWRPTT